MATIQAQTIVDLVGSVEKVRELIDRHPSLKEVAMELIEMKGPLPVFEPRTFGGPMIGGRGETRGRILSAGERKRRSLAMKRRWKAAKKNGKKTIAG